MGNKIKYINHSVGFKVGNIIYLNKNLKKYPKLHKKIIEHELKHSEDWNVNDLILDFTHNDLKGLKKEYYKFMVRHPKSFASLLPLIFIEGSWVFDLNLIIFYITFTIIITMIIISRFYL